jgi:hypothetical protein
VDPSFTHLLAYPPGGRKNVVHRVKGINPIATIHAFQELNICDVVPNIQGDIKRMPAINRMIQSCHFGWAFIALRS